jgi:chaperonin GroEL (HSP60 family)
MQFDRGYISPYFCNQHRKNGSGNGKNRLSLFHDKKISNLKEIASCVGASRTIGSSVAELLPKIG